MVIRQPIISVLGHIDHGKTTLLDSIRRTSIGKKEPRHITQHIGEMSLFRFLLGLFLAVFLGRTVLILFLVVDLLLSEESSLAEERLELKTTTFPVETIHIAA